VSRDSTPPLRQVASASLAPSLAKEQTPHATVN